MDTEDVRHGEEEIVIVKLILNEITLYDTF